MTDRAFPIPLMLEDAESVDTLIRNLVITCGFRDGNDSKLLDEILKQLQPQDPLSPGPVTLQLTLEQMRRLWDLLAAVRCVCKFEKREGYEFAEEFQQRVHDAAKWENEWFNVQRIFPKEGTTL